jgi:hypothetical protein
MPFFAGLGVLLALGTAERVAAAPASQLLEQEVRLAKPIDIAAREEPMAELVKRIGRETGAPLEASEEVADERVTLFAHARPARELLARVAEHFDYSWTRRTRAGVSRLVLIQDLAARKREEALRGGTSGELSKLRSLLDEQVALEESPEGREAARKSLQWRGERLDEIDERLNGKWVVERQGAQISTHRGEIAPLTVQDRRRLEQERRVLLQATPGRYEGFYALDSAARLYALLSPQEQAALWQGEPLRFAFPAEPGRIAIPREVALALGQGTLGTLARRTDEVTGVDRSVPLRSLDRVRGDLVLEPQGVGLKLRVRLRTLGSIGDEVHHSRREHVAQDAVESQSVLPSLPKDPVLDERAAALRDSITVPAAPPVEKQCLRLGDFLEALAARVPYPILADGYTTVNLARPLSAEKEPLSRLLTRTCKTFYRTCRFERGYLWLRSPDWATRRAMEPPARLVWRWEANLDTYHALPLRDLLEIAGRLTPEQAEVLRNRWQEQIPDGVSIALELDLAQSGTMLRLLHSLPPGTWRSLESGQSLPLGALPLRSRIQARACMNDGTEHLVGSDDWPLPNGEHWIPEAGFLEEDRLDAAWGRATLSLRRQPATWFIGTMGLILTKDVQEVLEQERRFHPKLTEKDLQRVEGELIEVVLAAPRAEPVSHFFLVPLTKSAN